MQYNFSVQRIGKIIPFLFSNTSDLNFVDFQGYKRNAMAEVGPW